jgi:hypothetical protein
MLRIKHSSLNPLQVFLAAVMIIFLNIALSLGGIGTLILVVLKLAAIATVAELSWLAVFSPFLVPFGISAAFGTLCLISTVFEK